MSIVSILRQKIKKKLVKSLISPLMERERPERARKLSNRNRHNTGLSFGTETFIRDREFFVFFLDIETKNR